MTQELLRGGAGGRNIFTSVSYGWAHSNDAPYECAHAHLRLRILSHLVDALREVVTRRISECTFARANDGRTC